jgi:hypothetical protein
MPDPTTKKFLVGTLSAGTALSNFIITETSPTIESDDSEIQDQDGNVAFVQHYNHRAVVSCNVVVPRGYPVPVKGASVTLKGVTLPTFDATGKCSGNPTITISEDPSQGSEVQFLVTASALTMSNTGVTTGSITLTRYLENGLGAIQTAEAAAPSSASNAG